ncbi:hypothetical protein [Neorhizobium galegae]|uniref:hypothetical protein n=1 Tax=Neorhizobium galegae TaxID=399 RepID=UPI00155F47B7|nr:hypothetical protein [Neorhizobium galegae]
MSIWRDKAVGAYYIAVSLIAFYPVRRIYLAATDIDIGGTFANCGASYLTSGLLWLSMTTLTVLLHMVIGLIYYTNNDEGPYGPWPVARRRKAPSRRRIVPYVANFAVIASIGIAGVMTFPKCRTPSGPSHPAVQSNLPSAL